MGLPVHRPAQLLRPRELDRPRADVKRVPPTQDVNEVAVEQVKGLLARLPKGEAAVVPLFVFDAGYDPVKLQQGLEESRAQILVKAAGGALVLRRSTASGPSYWTPPSPRGHKMKCAEPSTWPEPSAERTTCQDAGGYGTVRVLKQGRTCHPKVRAHAGRGSRGPLPKFVRGTLVLVEVERLPRGERRREPRVLWLWWHGPEPGLTPELLDLLWRAYARRFDTEHTFRFLKQTLGWTIPRVRHPEQADRWTWLVLAALRSYAWPARAWPTGDCRGRGVTILAA